MKRFEIFFGIIKIPIDLIMTMLAFMAAYQLRLVTEPMQGFAKPIDYTVLPTIKEYIEFSAIAAAALVTIFALGKLYTLRTTFNLSKEIRKVITVWAVWAMFMVTYFFFTRTFPFSRLAIIYSWGLTLVFIIFGRTLIKYIQKSFLRIGIGKRKLLFIGNNNITEELATSLKKDPSYKVVGVIGNTSKKTTIKHLGALSQLKYILKKHNIDEIIQTRSDLSETQSEDILELCDLFHTNFRFVPDLLEVRRTNVEVHTIGTIPVINIKPTPLDGWGKVTKRILDIAGAILGFTLLSPIFLATAIAIKADSKGPIIFCLRDDGKPVKRVGQQGKLFTFYKFRSMHPRTDSLRYSKLSGNNTRKEGPLVKIKDDPRVTRVGRFIRKYSIDELPQLWNVLTGKMSLVGPRPHLPEEVAKYKRHHKFVLTIKPGLTGLPQTSGRSDLEFEDEIKLDRYYIENWSILLDLRLILKTIFVVLRGHKE